MDQLSTIVSFLCAVTVVTLDQKSPGSSPGGAIENAAQAAFFDCPIMASLPSPLARARGIPVEPWRGNYKRVNQLGWLALVFVRPTPRIRPRTFFVDLA